jgi:microcompartment protein CcmL/EutN
MATVALGLVELNSIARGIVAADAMVKRAPVALRQSQPITPGKYLILIDGAVADVEEAMGAGTAVAGPTLVDRLFLPYVHEHVVAALTGKVHPAGLESLGVIETFTVAATVQAADAAFKAADVRPVELRLARGLGGKGFFVLTGELDQVEAAVAAGCAVIAPAVLVAREIVAAPHEDLSSRLLR